MEPDPRTARREELLAQMGWVRELARRLVRDGEPADDLAQSTWVAALEHPPRVEQGETGLRRWLGVVMRNIARQSRRSEARRTLRERIRARPEDQPSAEDVVARGAMQKQVTDAVMGLEEPYRSTILYRYLDGLSAPRIAELQGVSPATVRKRLSRGIEMLRGRLDAAFGSDRRAWVLGLGTLVPESGALGATSVGAWIMSTKTIAMGVAVAVAVVGGIWLVLRGPASEPGGIQAGGPVLPSGPIAAGEEPGRTTIGAVSSARVAVDVGSTADGTPSHRLTVLEAATGRPLPEAEVWYGPSQLLRELNASKVRGENPDLEGMLRDAGKKRISDRNGDLFFDGVEGWSISIGRSGDLYGVLYFGAEPEWPLRLELHPDRSIKVQTVDEDGNPLPGVLVGVRMGGEPGEDADWKARTLGENATAVLRHFGHEFRVELEQGRLPFVTLPFPLKEPIEVELDPNRLPDGPVRLVVPATGRVVIELLDDGKGSKAPRWAHLTAIQEDVMVAGRSRWGARYSLYSQNGRAVFTQVGVGLLLKASMDSSAEEPHDVAEATVPGPREPGEEVRIALHFGPLGPVLVGRLLDGAGRPLVRSRARLRFRILRADGERVEESGSLTTDEEGRFREGVRSRVTSAVSCELRIQSEATADRPALGATLGASLALRGGDIPLGDVVLFPLPLIASGVVLDTRGEPIYWAAVDLARKRFYDGERFVWDWVHWARVQSAEDGRFEMRGELEPGEYGLHVFANSYVREDVKPLVPGTGDLRIVLTGSGVLEGSVVLPEGIPPPWLAVEVRAHDQDPEYQPPRTPGLQSTHLRPSGGFRVEPLWPGRSEVRIHIPWDPEPLVVVEDVWIEEGKTTRDPRLEGLDLEVPLSLFEIEVVDPADQPVGLGYVAFRPLGRRDAAIRRISLSEGRASILTRWPAIDLDVVGLGYRTAHLEGVGTDQRVVLRRGIPVRIRLPQEVKLPDPPVRLMVGLLRVEDYRHSWLDEIHSQDGTETIRWAAWADGTFQGFDGGHEALLELPEAGVYQVLWQLEARTSSHGMRAAIDKVEVADTREGITLELWPARDSYAKVLEAFRAEL